MRSTDRGFTLLEVVVALTVVGVGVTALLIALAQGRRNLHLTSRWAEQEQRANGVLFQVLEEWQQLRSEPGRRAGLVQHGQDPTLGPWEWRAMPKHRLEGRPVDLYRVHLSWATEGKAREVETRAVLRVVP